VVKGVSENQINFWFCYFTLHFYAYLALQLVPGMWEQIGLSVRIARGKILGSFNGFGIKVTHKLLATRFSRSLVTSPANALGKSPVGFGRIVLLPE
jgi:hypothetical protein